MLSVEHVTKVFPGPGGEVPALSDITFSVKDGEFVSIVGKSGSGKSTLLSLLGALDTPTSGSIFVDDDDIAQLSRKNQTSYRARKIGFVFQHYNLVTNLTALENVMLALEYGGVASTDRKQRAIELLDEVDIKDAMQHRKPGKLSGGQQQRVSIARALANKPSIILADEPTGNLDSATGRKVFDLLHHLSRAENTTIITVTHDLDIAGKTDRTFTLKDGVLVKA